MTSEYMAYKTGEPDYHQIYKKAATGENGDTYISYAPHMIYKSKALCDKAINLLMESEDNHHG